MRGVVGYFGFDLADRVVQKRIAQWRHAGFKVLSFAFVRTPVKSGEEEFTDLGVTMALSRWRRLPSLLRAMLRLSRHRRRLAGLELFIARNLDLLLLAIFARWIAGTSAPIVYEVLDVNFSCLDGGWQGRVIRALERWSIRRIELLLVSSPRYVTHYYRPVLGYGGSWLLFENKLPRYLRATRPLPASPGAAVPGRPWRIGWFGYLDDWRSWAALRDLAAAMPERAAIRIHGRANADFDHDRFMAELRSLPNVSYGGPYKSPDDLAVLYASVDMVWSADCTSPVGNPQWLLTNGLYEAGFFGKPILVFAGNRAMCEAVRERNCGWCLEAPLAEGLQQFIRGLSFQDYRQKCAAIATMPEQAFVESDEIEQIWQIATQPDPQKITESRRWQHVAR
jgi:succinoglycan biosynthesis protein ExoL